MNVGNDFWVGYGTLITNKCTNIGNGAVIGAGSVVTKDVPAYSVVAGNPAKVIRYRFDEKTIKLIEGSKWWELTPEELMKYYDVIGDPVLFTKEIINDRKNKSK